MLKVLQWPYNSQEARLSSSPLVFFCVILSFFHFTLASSSEFLNLPEHAYLGHFTLALWDALSLNSHMIQSSSHLYSNVTCAENSSLATHSKIAKLLSPFHTFSLWALLLSNILHIFLIDFVASSTKIWIPWQEKVWCIYLLLNPQCPTTLRK